MKYFAQSKQKGSAALLFILIFPALFAIFVWGVEGARVLQSSARLKDAAESAAIAVSAQQNVTNDECYAITQGFVGAYFPQAQSVQVPAVHEGSSIVCVDESSETSIKEFTITAQVTENTWFPSAQIANFGDTFSFSDSVTVRQDQSTPMDVILVANYASTMTDSSHNFKKNQKIDKLEEAVQSIASKLAESELPNQLALIGFDHYVSKFEDDGANERWRLDHYMSFDETGHAKSACSRKSSRGSKMGDIENCLDSIDESSLFNASKINVDSTLDKLFSNTLTPVSLFDLSYRDKGSKIDKIKISGHRHSVMDTIELTSDFPKIYNAASGKGKSGFKVVKGKSDIKGASYTGLIGGARLADQGTNPKRLIILLTDGIEQAPAVAQKLVDQGLCRRIQQHFTNQSVEIELAIIGFDYDDVSGADMRRCIGASRQYNYSPKDSAANDELIDQLLNFSSNGVGRLVQ